MHTLNSGVILSRSVLQRSKFASHISDLFHSSEKCVVASVVEKLIGLICFM
jgi:hypothetical protein